MVCICQCQSRIERAHELITAWLFLSLAGDAFLDGNLEGVSNAQPAVAELQAWIMNGGEASMLQVNTLLARRAAMHF